MEVERAERGHSLYWPSARNVYRTRGQRMGVGWLAELRESRLCPSRPHTLVTLVICRNAGEVTKMALAAHSSRFVLINSRTDNGGAEHIAGREVNVSLLADLR